MIHGSGWGRRNGAAIIAEPSRYANGLMVGLPSVRWRWLGGGISGLGIAWTAWVVMMMMMMMVVVVEDWMFDICMVEIASSCSSET